MARHRSGRKPSDDDQIRPLGPGATERALLDILRVAETSRAHADGEIDAFLDDLDRAVDDLPEPETPLLRAQYLVYDAWDAPPEQRAELARRALEISPDCADAYIVLATRSEASERRALFEQAVAAAQRTLDPRWTDEAENIRLRRIATRPYVRAVHALALELWAEGDRRAAADLFQTQLRLDPVDPFRARVELARIHLQECDFDALATLLDRYGRCDSADWAYARALLLFRAEGSSVPARVALAEAFDENSLVPFLFLGALDVPDVPPDPYADDPKSLAQICFAHSHHAWRAADGAVEWLNDELVGAIERERGAIPLNPDDVLVELQSPARALPRAALRSAVNLAEEVTPGLLRILEQTPEEIAERPEYLGHIYAMFVLAQLRDARAYEPIVRLLATAGSLVDVLFDDTLTERMSQILASVSGGDVGPMKRLFEDRTLDPYVRMVGLSAMLCLVAEGAFSRSDTVEYLGERMRSKVEDEHPEVWTTLIDTAADLGAVELEGEIESAVAEGLVEMRPIDFEEAMDALRTNAGAHVPVTSRGTVYGYIDDAVAEIERLYFAEREPVERSRNERGRSKPRRSKNRRKAAKASRKRNRPR